MQAGDKLNFIKPFEGQQQELDVSSVEVSEEDVAVLASFLKHFINDRPDNTHSFDILESSGFVKIFESSYKLDMADGSYLHIVVHGSIVDDGISEFGVSVIEHLNDGIYNGGYTYTYNAEGLVRSRAMTDDVDPEAESDPDMDIRKLHFTVSDLYATREELHEMKFSDDPELRAHAEEAQAQLEAEMQFDEMMQAQGFDSQPPFPGELDSLRELIWNAKPFPLHVVTD